MLPMPIADHDAIMEELARTGKYVKVLWQSQDTLMFIARGREYRSEFHINPSDEHMTMLKGDMNLHYRKPDGTEDIAVLKEGETIYIIKNNENKNKKRCEEKLRGICIDNEKITVPEEMASDEII